MFAYLKYLETELDTKKIESNPLIKMNQIYVELQSSKSIFDSI